MITGDMLISEVVEKYPEVIDTLLSYDVHCVGCHVSSFESLHDGLIGHGKSESVVEQIIVKLNEVVKANHVEVEEKIVPDLTITPVAAAKIEGFCAGDVSKGLRISISAGGCGGKKYEFDIEMKHDEDYEFLRDAARVFVAKDALVKMNGSILDFKDSLSDAGFRITNPMASSTCGCGTSFR